jgi:hypothetical protein
MLNWHVVLMVVVYLLIVGGIHAIASEEFESPGRESCEDRIS